jgi:hypothetical protein
VFAGQLLRSDRKLSHPLILHQALQRHGGAIPENDGIPVHTGFSRQLGENDILFFIHPMPSSFTPCSDLSLEGTSYRRRRDPGGTQTAGLGSTVEPKKLFKASQADFGFS